MISNPILPLKFVAQELGTTEHHLTEIARRQHGTKTVRKVRGQVVVRTSFRAAASYPRFVRKGPRRWGVYQSEWLRWNESKQMEVL